MNPTLRTLLPLALLLSACKSEHSAEAPVAAKAPPAETVDWRRDYHSYANTAAFVTEHLSLDLEVDFAQRVLSGSVALKLKKLQTTASELVLDTRDLQIDKVETAAGDGGWTATTFKLAERDAILGSALHIAMPATADRVRIFYKTQPQASGLQWLTPEQTADRKQPFLFTQSQSIHARSWIPLQDTPQVRATYDAHIRTPKTVLAVMAAENEDKGGRDGDYRFRMPQAIPSYLIALAVGDLKFKATGPRTGIYAEPSVLEAAAREFSDTEKMLVTTEQVYGPYRWGRYDLLILPPSFPYGGMENPRLTFASPSVVVGDKSLVALVAHELAHSWSGNLVTNATWRDFWLNEGFTTYLTDRIMETVYGIERSEMQQVLAAQALRNKLKDLDPKEAVMATDRRGLDPDDSVSEIAYNKGALFLHNLETAFGREHFDVFLKRWFDEHAFKSQTSEDFLKFLDAELLPQPPAKFPLEKASHWIYAATLPPDTVWPKSDAFDRTAVLRGRWIADEVKTEDIDASRWSVDEWLHFIDGLPTGVKNAQLAALDQKFKLSETRNKILARSWFIVAIAHDYQPAYPAIEQHLKSTGRMYLIKPLYRELVKSESGLAFAKRVYEQARPSYHPIAQSALDEIVLKAAPPEKAAAIP